MLLLGGEPTWAGDGTDDDSNILGKHMGEPLQLLKVLNLVQAIQNQQNGLLDGFNQGLEGEGSIVIKISDFLGGFSARIKLGHNLLQNARVVAVGKRERKRKVGGSNLH